MRKRLFAVLLLAGCFVLLCACGGAADCSSDTLDGVSVTLEGMRFSNKGIHVAIPEAVIRNGSGSDLMEVFYEVTFFGKDGSELGAVRMFWLGEEPLPAGGEATQDDSRFVLPFADDPARAEVRVTGFKTAEEMPPIHVPEEGEYLYAAVNSGRMHAMAEDKPVRVTVHIDQGGYGREAVFDSEPLLGQAVDAFLKIRVGADDAPMVTDNYNWFLFEWADGERYGIRLNLDAFEYDVYGRYHSYYLTGAEEFWSLAYAHLREME